jgi:hypothetical protein
MKDPFRITQCENGYFILNSSVGVQALVLRLLLRLLLLRLAATLRSLSQFPTQIEFASKPVMLYAG